MIGVSSPMIGSSKSDFENDWRRTGEVQPESLQQRQSLPVFVGKYVASSAMHMSAPYDFVFAIWVKSYRE